MAGALLEWLTPTGLIPSLAQEAASSERSDPWMRILMAWGFLLPAIILLAVLIVAIKRRMNRPDETVTASAFSLGQLRAMHRDGQLSDEEFERAKAAVIAQGLTMMNPQGTPDDEDLPESGPSQIVLDPDESDEDGFEPEDPRQ